MYNSQYYTCEQIDQRLLQGYVDDYNSENNTDYTKSELLTLIGSYLSSGLKVTDILQQLGTNTDKVISQKVISELFDIVASDTGVTISAYPNTVYKAVAYNLNLSGVMKDKHNTSRVASSLKLYDATNPPTLLKEVENASSISHTVSSFVTTTNENGYMVEGIIKGLTYRAGITVQARYPIYYGFAASPNDLAVDANRYDPTTTAAHTYQKTAVDDGQHFYILVPSDISALTHFTMGGAPFVMTASTVTIDGVTYKVYTSGNTYNSGTKLTVVAS